jgi:cell division protease FtsH
MHCPYSPPIDRITIRGDTAGALGYVRYQDRQHKFVVTRNEMIDTITVLMGGREAEALLLDDLSIGSSEDLRRATIVARALVEELGMGGDTTGVMRFNMDEKSQRHPHLSEVQRAALDQRVREVIEECRQKAATILREQQTVLESLRDLLLVKKTVDAKALSEMAAPPNGK